MDVSGTPSDVVAAASARSGPRISIVVPVFNVAAYLDECLGSILDQSFTDLEVIAVDGNSDDGSNEKIKRWAGRDARVRPRYLDEHGAGRARNAGLKLARGDFVWFVDADDLLIQGALAAIAARLGQVEPDVLLIGYDELLPGGQVRPGGQDTLLRTADPAFKLADNPGVVFCAMTAWSKIFRRDFLQELQVPFPPGRHEDVPVSSAALLSADTIGVLDRVCYRYRKSRSGALMSYATSDNKTIFDSYHHVFEMIEKKVVEDDPKVTGRVVSAFFERAIQHYANVLNTGGAGWRNVSRLVPTSYRREFFRLMHDDYLAYRPGGFRRPAGLRGIQFLLIQRDAFWAYAMLEPLNHLRVGLLQACSRAFWRAPRLAGSLLGRR